MANSIEIILNAGSGSQRAGEMRLVLEQVLGESERSFSISIGSGTEIARLAEAKAATDCEVLVAGGGDGTICTVAEVALRTGKILGVLPLGTFNYFARSLQIPLELEPAARVLLAGKPTHASVLDLDGRLVLNNASIGIHPAVLLRRKNLYRRWGRSQLNTYLSVLVTALLPPPRLRVRLATDQGEIVRVTPLVMVCSNSYEMETFALAGLECLEAGKFALYIAQMAGRTSIFPLALRVAMRRLRVGVDYEAICASDVTIETLRHRHVRVALDGEVERRQSPLRIRTAPQELRVLAPDKAQVS
jgi:diacylglycerol kinase family enzyme